MTHLVTCLPFKHEDLASTSRHERQRQEDPGAHTQARVVTLLSSRFGEGACLQKEEEEPLVSMHIETLDKMLVQGLER